MKRIFTIMAMLAWCFTMTAKPVDEATARQTGYNFLMYKAKAGALKAGETLKTVSLANTGLPGGYYVFNASHGFVIVSADDAATPILGYSNEQPFGTDRISPQLKEWLGVYASQISEIQAKNIPAPASITRQWTELVNTAGALAPQQTNTVSPLLKTTWDQSPYYNDQCPYDYTYGERAVTGCVATAMAQVMKFWSYPSSGSDFHSYNDKNYGTLSADFGSTTYDWANMPLSVKSTNSAVATLMYHCGVSVNMGYGVAKTGGSSAYVVSAASASTNCAEYALKTYFGYKSTLKGILRNNYSDASWLSTIEGELDAGRPVIYAGFGSGGGHCFVCDGYDGNNYLHFNWGWSGYYNGYFQMSALNPGGVGTGGGSGGYNANQQAIIGIEAPQNTGGSGDMSLYDNVTLSASTIYYGQAFTVTTNVLNTGTATFNGDYCAAIFDNNSNFVDYVEILSSQSLPSGYKYTNGLTFSYAGSFSMLPGTYTIGVYYRPTGQNWKEVSDYSGYTNYAQLNVVNPGSLEMYSSMSVTPGTTLTQGKSVSVNFDIVNATSNTFYGDYDLSLYNLDGTHAFTIQTYTSQTLPASYHYNGGLTFSNSKLDAQPGTYLLAMLYKPQGSSNYYLTGSTNYQNPIKVIVQAPPLNPDIYENNNSVATAYRLNANFSGGNADVSTPGANCHIGSDLDYYKIVLPAGMDYTLYPRLSDAQGSANSNTYTLNGMFSYSTDGGNTWSDTYESAPPSYISINNGGTIYFLVSPIFSGQTGTYLLDVNMQESVTGIRTNKIDAELINLYPNPASSNLHIDMKGIAGEVTAVSVTDLNGKEVFRTIPQQQKDINVPLQNIGAGIYFVKVETADGVLNKKFVVAK